MKLKDIIKKSTLQTKIINPLNFFVKGISIHSDQVRNNFIFAAIKGGSHHGLDFIKDLLNYKNIAVVLSKVTRYPKILEKIIQLYLSKSMMLDFLFQKLAQFFFEIVLNKRLRSPELMEKQVFLFT